MYKLIGFSLCVFVIIVVGYLLWQQQDLRKNMQVQRELSTIYKMASKNADQHTVQFIQAAEQDQHLSQTEWQQIQHSHAAFLQQFDPSDAQARERAFMQRKALHEQAQ
jgi:ferritin